MKEKLLMVLLFCAVLTLSACGAAQNASVPEKGAQNPEETVEEIPEAAWDDDGETFEEAEAEAIFAPLVGVWTPDAGMGILTIYQNGGFLFDADDALEGYLVYTEEDGEDWETGPRYELYEENNERVPNCYFALDEQHPGKLVYAVGGGAELFSRTNAAYDDDGEIFRVEWADGASDFSAYDGGDAQTIAFSTERVLPDFKFLEIAWVDSNENGSFFSVKELHSLDALSPERSLTVQTSFPGDMPTNGVSFTDASGATKYYAVLESGYDASLVVSAFKLSQTP